MRQSLAGAALASLAIFLGSSAATQQGTTIRLDDLTLDRAFRVTVQIPGSPTYAIAGTGLVIPTSPSLGMAITRIRGDWNAGTLWYSVNGNPAEAFRIVGPNEFEVDPPIVVRPGSSIELGITWNAGAQLVTIAGYVLHPGEV